jgi:predicted metal-binding membrane protein
MPMSEMLEPKDAPQSGRSALRAIPRRERIAILAGLAGVTAVSWLYLIAMAAGMSEMDGMQAGDMMGVRAWTAMDAALMFFMWAVMMVGMMVPSATSMILVYAAVARKAARQASPVAPTAVFVVGYVVAWTLFSVAATIAQWGLDQAALLSPMMVTTSPALGAGLLVAAGLYQLTPYKNTCLERCRAPAQFISSHWRPGSIGAFRMGLSHGLFCLGCCWLLMGLLFFGGVMNLLWIAGITLFVLLEKILPAGAQGGRFAGVAMLIAGLASLAYTLSGDG